MKPTDLPAADKAQALSTLQQGIARLEAFSCQDAASAAFLTWRAQMLDVLIALQGENALCVFEWRVLRFVPASVPDDAHARLVWKSGQNYARLLLRSVQEKQPKI